MEVLKSQSGIAKLTKICWRAILKISIHFNVQVSSGRRMGSCEDNVEYPRHSLEHRPKTQGSSVDLHHKISRCLGDSNFPTSALLALSSKSKKRLRSLPTRMDKLTNQIRYVLVQDLHSNRPSFPLPSINFRIPSKTQPLIVVNEDIQRRDDSCTPRES